MSNPHSHTEPAQTTHTRLATQHTNTQGLGITPHTHVDFALADEPLAPPLDAVAAPGGPGDDDDEEAAAEEEEGAAAEAPAGTAAGAAAAASAVLDSSDASPTTALSLSLNTWQVKWLLVVATIVLSGLKLGVPQRNTRGKKTTKTITKHKRYKTVSDVWDDAAHPAHQTYQSE